MDKLAVIAAGDTDTRLLRDDPMANCPPLGSLIGRGKQRWVYAHRDDPEIVVKLLRPEWQRVNSNAAEWRNWRRIRETEYAPHFAPCLGIGTAWLTMRRCEPLGKGATGWIPDICRDDPSRHNFGILGGRIVCVDYANMLTEQIGDTAKFIELGRI